ncbi:ribosomal RNA small subunit methyltransferase A [Myxococcota bacterium]|nr:ribosomal RNA small subunit methyltransferase A [Myxococcota bacterium]MBU1379279.1 ribosomal RNA small subunit methyltransferase A [Myxococcota bacterium]MBU1499015.1 ribosomal RNA small subunit methyltransferase A [Myxococcota bacterium]
MLDKNFRADKSWGQNYLVNRGIIKKIVEACELEKHDNIIEIGAGKGALTSEIAEKGPCLTALEPHNLSFEYLIEKFKDNPTVKIIQEDATIFDFSAIIDGSTVIVGNLPYNVSSRILKRLFETACTSAKWILMFQREMAERITAQEKTSDYGALSVMTFLYTKPQLLFHVKPGSFSPAPKIESSVVEFVPHNKYPEINSDMFELWLKKIFSMRRKKIGGILKNFLQEGYAAEVLSRSGISAEVRPQDISPGEFFILISIILTYTIQK